MSDLTERARAALEGITDEEWFTEESCDNRGDASVVYESRTKGRWPLFICPDCGVLGETTQANAEFIAAAQALVPELVSEVERMGAQWRDGGETASQVMRERDEANAAIERVRALCDDGLGKWAADILAALDGEA